jgi:PAS domain S-box-containing protein
MLNNKKTKEQFLDIAYLLSSSLDLQFILNKITEERTLSLLSSKRAVIYLLDSKKGFLKPVATLNNPNVAQIMSGKLPVKSSLSGNVVKTKKATIFNNTSQYSNAYHIPGTLDDEDENLLVLPLIVEKTILGTLNLYRNRELYLKEDVKYAKIFALYASTAINNALKHQQLIREISDRKQSEAKLRESEERFRILFESSHDALMTLNPPTWKFTSGNPAIAKMFNVKNVKEFLTYGPWDISPVKQPDGKLSSEKAIEMIEIAMTKGSNFFEWTHKRINGKSFPTTVLLTRIQLKDKTFLQVTVRDITERKKAEEEVQKYQHELEELVDERTAKLEIAK